MKKINKFLILTLLLVIPLNNVFAYYSTSNELNSTFNTQSYNIKINVDGGTISDDLVIKHNKLELPIIEKEGYEFLGYSTSNNGTVVYNAGDEVNITNINNRTLYAIYEEIQTPTKVNLIQKIRQLSDEGSSDIISDDGTTDHNIRYYGLTPNNYVKFNENDSDVWRIVGLFNNVEDSNGVKLERVKLIRNNSIGRFSWDSSTQDINYGFGVNQWSDADLMKLLNPNYDNNMDSTYTDCSYNFDLGETICQLKSASEKVNNSLWWNSSKGICYTLSYNQTEECDFTSGDSIGPSVSAKSMIENVVWKLGGINRYFSSPDTGNANYFYNEERGTTVYQCQAGDAKCPRSTRFTSRVGLVYPSDYGFATAGGSVYNRQQCLNMSLNHWGYYDNDGDCVNSNWLFMSQHFFLSPAQSSPFYVLNVSFGGQVSNLMTDYSGNVHPSVYIKREVLISKGTGTSDDPYILTLD